jgi:hypothetical protein
MNGNELEGRTLKVEFAVEKNTVAA